MLSRVANNLYWTARYLERAEDTARLINVHSNLSLDLPRHAARFGWQPLVSIISGEADFSERYRSASETNVIKYLITDEQNSSSILSSVDAARENLRTTRDVVPREAWEEVNDLHHVMRDQLASGLSRRVRYDFLQRVIRSVQLSLGIIENTMSHGTGYHFMRVGHYLERADMTSRILDVRSANLLRTAEDVEDLTPFDNIQWMGVLKSLTAYQMYRQHVRLRVQGPDVLNFIMCDTAFPRAIHFCLHTMAASLKKMPRSMEPLRVLKQVQQQIEQADMYKLALDKAALHQFIDELQGQLGRLHNGLNQVYFSTQQQQQAA